MKLTRPITVQITLGAFVIVLLAALSMASTLWVAKQSSHDATAVNLSGSLRMQTYRLAYAIQNNDQLTGQYLSNIIEDLNSPILKNALQPRQLHQLTQLQNRWAVMDIQQQSTLFDQIQQLVDQTDALVQLYENNAHDRWTNLAHSQWLIGLFLIIILGLVVWVTQKKLVKPLSLLLLSANQLGNKQFNHSINYQSNDELGLLVKSFNEMTAALSELYGHLEEKVEKKTKALKQSHQSLDFLYKNARKLTRDLNFSNNDFQDIIDQVKSISNCDQVYLCLKQDKYRNYQLIATNDEKPVFCQKENCSECGHNKMTNGFHRYNITDSNQNYGYLFIKANQLQNWQQQLYQACAELIAHRIKLSDTNIQQAKLSLNEERNIIARELHDGLAQNLSYQKIQMVRLKKLMANNGNEELINNVIEEAQQSLVTCYKQLRHIISSFRIKLDEINFRGNLESSINEFNLLDKTDFQLNFQLDHCPLTANEEMHCLLIIRESMNNIIKHANAQKAYINIHQPDDDVVITIDDDGLGFKNETLASQSHYGLQIMQERANFLGGKVTVSSTDDHTQHSGTQVSLVFKPQIIQTRGLS